MILFVTPLITPIGKATKSTIVGNTSEIGGTGMFSLC
jgi:hypothetical protein